MEWLILTFLAGVVAFVLFVRWGANPERVQRILDAEWEKFMQEWKREEGQNYPEPVEQVPPLSIRTPKDAVRELKICERDEIPAVIRQALSSIQTWYGWHQVWVNFDLRCRNFPRSTPFIKIARSVMREAYAEHEKSGEKGLWDRRRIWNVLDRYARTPEAEPGGAPNSALKLPTGQKAVRARQAPRAPFTGTDKQIGPFGMRMRETISSGEFPAIVRVVLLVAGIVILCGGGSFGFNWLLFGYQKAVEAFLGVKLLFRVLLIIFGTFAVWYFVVAFLEETGWGRVLVNILMVPAALCIIHGCASCSESFTPPIYFWLGVLHLWVSISLRCNN